MTVSSDQAGASAAYGTERSALLIAGEAGAAAAGAQALSVSGLRRVGTVGWGDAVTRLAAQAAVDLILIEAGGADDDTLAPILSEAAVLARGNVAVVVAIDPGQIDFAAPVVFGSTGIQLLCAPTFGERISAILLATLPRGSATLHDSARDGEAARLQRLNEEVARIAETLARLTQGDGRAPGLRGGATVSDPSLSFRVEPPGPVAVAATAADVRRTIRARRLRDQFFGAGLFEDPAWDMLLDLFAADLERARVSVSSLCIAAAVAPTTALRWIQRMTDAGLFVREADPFDRRRAFLALSSAARDGMLAYWSAAARLASPSG